MTTINCRNPIYSAIDNSTIDVELEHPDYGWIPFTASPDDVEPLGVTIFEAAKRGDYGEVAPYVPPPEPEPQIPSSCTRRQGRLALLDVEKLDAVEAAIELAGAAARIEYEADTWDRDNVFLNALWEQLGGTQQELDDLFILAVNK